MIEPRFTAKMLPLSARIAARLGASAEQAYEGMPPEYEVAMRRMLIAGIDYINAHPNLEVKFKEYENIFGMIDDLNEDAKKLHEVIVAATSDCSSAQTQEIMGYLAYIMKLGWPKFVEMMEYRFQVV